MRTLRHHCLGIVVLAVCSAASIPSVLGQGACPPVLARLMPGNAAGVVGQYTSAGAIGLGTAAGELPFDHPCLQGTKYPGRIRFDVKHYSGNAVKIFQTQIDAEEQQRIKNEREELARRHKGHSVSTDGSSGGTLVYVEYESPCSKGSVPYVSLVGMAHSDSTAINVRVEGAISFAVAKAAAGDVLRKFASANFD